MTMLIFSCYFSVASARWRHSLNAHFCRHKVEKDDVASFNLRPSFCRKLLIISKQQHQIQTAECRTVGQNIKNPPKNKIQKFMKLADLFLQLFDKF